MSTTDTDQPMIRFTDAKLLHMVPTQQGAVSLPDEPRKNPDEDMLKSLIAQCWYHDPAVRPDAAEVEKTVSQH
jgi:hypothetical protein